MKRVLKFISEKPGFAGMVPMTEGALIDFFGPHPRPFATALCRLFVFLVQVALLFATGVWIHRSRRAWKKRRAKMDAIVASLNWWVPECSRTLTEYLKAECEGAGWAEKEALRARYENAQRRAEREIAAAYAAIEETGKTP